MALYLEGIMCGTNILRGTMCGIEIFIGHGFCTVFKEHYGWNLYFQGAQWVAWKFWESCVPFLFLGGTICEGIVLMWAQSEMQLCFMFIYIFEVSLARKVILGSILLWTVSLHFFLSHLF